MTTSNPESDEPIIFSALLTPHRSLTPRGFFIVMGFISAVSFVAGVAFLMMGAWPVFGFFGLDVALIYYAFRVNYARAAAFEEIIVTHTQVHVRKVNHRGTVSEWHFNPLWVRLGVITHEAYGTERMFLTMRKQELTIGQFLGPEEKASFAEALKAALHAARRGPDHNPIVQS